MSQMTFDLDQMIHELDVQDLPKWEGSPLHFTTDYFTPAEHFDAWQHYRFVNGNFNCIRESRMWHASITLGNANTDTAGHSLLILAADLRCDHYGQTSRDCSCVGSLISQAICDGCHWNSIGTQPHVVEAWHDHAWPGWRGLPIIPIAANKRTMGKASPRLNKWIEANYPADWQAPGAPIITERDGIGTAHVPGRSPWNGFDLSHRALAPSP